MEFLLTGYNVITSKKNGKEYILYYLLFNKQVIIPCISAKKEKFLEFLAGNLMEDVTSYVGLRYVKDKEAFIPYIR